MNLIEQQNAAKDLPPQYLQQAANGQNPNLTPWIATAELQRRTTMNQHMQKGAEGPMPTVKDQVEQKAGLMATQAAQQAQGAQMQQAAMPPGPVPEGTPTPEAQPEQPVMAAHGGLMNAPTNLRFAKGGILGFDGEDDGSYVDPATGIPLVNTSTGDSDETLREYITRNLGFTEEAKRQKANRKTNEATEAKADRRDTPAPREVPAAARADDRAPRPSMQGQGIKAALPQPAVRPQHAPAPAVSKPQQVMQKPVMDPEQQIAMDYTKSATPQASMQAAIGNEQQLAQKYGLDQPMGVEERDIIAQRNAAREAARQRQAKDAFAAYAAGTIGVPGSAGLAYSQARQAQDAAEREHLSANLKDIKELNTAQRAAGEKRAGIAGADFTAQQKATAEALKDKATVAAQMFNISSQAASDAARNMTSLEVARIHAASANRPGETERIMATAIGLKATDPAKFATFMETLGAIRGAGKPDQGAAIADKANDNVTAMMKANPMLGIKYSQNPALFRQAVAEETTRLQAASSNGGAGAAPGGATRLKFDAQGNQIK